MSSGEIWKSHYAYNEFEQILRDAKASRMKKKHLIIVVSVITALWVANGLIILFSSDKCGIFGDQFGAVNSLFSGLAFLGLIYTILQQRESIEMQRQDLHNQQEVLALTHKEHEKQTKEFLLQNENLNIQRFEGTFFSMLTLLQNIVNELSLTYKEIQRSNITRDYDTLMSTPSKAITGRGLFEFLYENHDNYILLDNISVSGLLKELSNEGISNKIKKQGIQGYEESIYPTYFDHYFRTIYRILKFVEESSYIKDNNKKYEYTSLLRAQLSKYELVWLHYNGLSSYGRDKLKPLIEKYAMLKNLRDELLVLEPEGEMPTYSPEAYRKTQSAPNK